MKIEKSPFGKYYSNGYRQKLSMDAKITGQKV